MREIGATLLAGGRELFEFSKAANKSGGEQSFQNPLRNKFPLFKIDKKACRRDALIREKTCKNHGGKSLKMAENGDDPIASWNERVTSLRKRGRISGAALTVMPASEIDVRQGRPQAPERLSAEERELGRSSRIVVARDV